MDRGAGGLIRFPLLSALLTAFIAFVSAVVVTQPSVWPHFSWIMSGVDYVNGVSRGIAPFLRGGCVDLATARAAASLIMLALGGAVLALGLFACVLAVRAVGDWAKPVHDSRDQSFMRFMFNLARRGLLFSCLLVSAGIFRHFWLTGGGEVQDTAIFSCAASSVVGEIAYICAFGFIVLAPPLALLKRIHRFFVMAESVSRSA